MSISLYALLLAAHVFPSLSAVLPASRLDALQRSTPCQNTPSTRSCWADGYDINTDSDLSYPTTGNTVAYTLEITNSTCNLDGSGEKICMLVNGQFPGPTLRAQWGDTLEVTIVNSMQNNGTSIHFHGVRQLNSPGNDGVNGISQCAIAPGDSATYKFQATQYGTSWYHSHTTVQYGDGVIGPIVFEGPAAANYDIDLGPYVLNDYWSTQTAWQIAALAEDDLAHFKGPPDPATILVNGTSTNASGGGKHNVVAVQNGKKYLLRLINAAMDNYIRVSLDQHPMLVVAADFVPVKPFSTDWLLLGIGQRYDVIISADQGTGSYWFYATAPFDCSNGTTINANAIWTYGGTANVSTPTSSSNPTAPSGCLDQSVSPIWPGSVPSKTLSESLAINVTGVVTSEDNLEVVWTLGDPIRTNYSDPTIGYVMRNDQNYPAQYNVINSQSNGQWNYWLIYNNLTVPSIPHPIHLHGHNFYVIGSGVGTFDQATVELNWTAPARRDTQSVPGSGWLVIAFKSDNPGTWLMHCHIAVHIAEGLGLQYVESPSNITLPEINQYNSVCGNWDKYSTTAKYIMDESGL